jgi:dihydroorotase
MKRLYRNGQIVSSTVNELVDTDVLVDGECILAVGTNLAAGPDTVIIDCKGRVLLPGLFDMHVHASEPGREDKEDIHSASEAAIHGGFTGIVLQPSTMPVIDSGGAVQNVLDIAREKSRLGTGVYVSGAITKGRKGEELAGVAGMKSRGVLFLSDAGRPIANPQVLRRAMEYARQFDLPLATHCEVTELSGKGSMHEGSVSYSLGLQGLPAISEEIGITRDIRLAEYCGVHLHVQHLSTRKGMDTIRRAKERGIRVTCEVTPHHLLFNHKDIGDYNTLYKVNPPLRTEDDNAALLEGLEKGWIDVIATDHSPHTEFEKNQDFASAPFGITGLEMALPSLHHHFIKPGRMTWSVLVKRLSAEPRKLLQLEPVSIAQGSVAEFIVFNPALTSQFTPQTMKSKSLNTPFLHQKLDGLVERVIVRGAELLAR